MEPLAIILAALIFGCLVLWVKENKWSENDTQNFTKAARKGSRMKNKK